MNTTPYPQGFGCVPSSCQSCLHWLDALGQHETSAMCSIIGTPTAPDYGCRDWVLSVAKSRLP